MMDLLAKQLLKGVEGAASSVDGQIVVADGTTGKKIAFDSNKIADVSLITDIDDTPVDGVTTAPISSNWAYDHKDLGEHDEIRLTPKAASTGPEGTMFYDLDDDHVYVATE